MRPSCIFGAMDERTDPTPNTRPSRARPSPPVILVTGFGAFPGAPSNPSAALVTALGGAFTRRIARLDLRLERRILPVVFREVGPDLEALFAELAPVAVLHVGLAGRRSSLCVETRASRMISGLHPDAKGALPASRRVAAGQETLRARLPAARLLAALRRAGVPSRLSIDAGGYVCNQTLYLTLSSRVPIAGFIHIPRPRRRLARAGHSWTRRPALADMVRAIQNVLLEIAVEVRNSRP